MGIALDSWADVYFRLDEPSGEYRVDEVKLGGI